MEEQKLKSKFPGAPGIIFVSEFDTSKERVI